VLRRLSLPMLLDSPGLLKLKLHSRARVNQEQARHPF